MSQEKVQNQENWRQKIQGNSQSKRELANKEFNHATKGQKSELKNNKTKVVTQTTIIKALDVPKKSQNLGSSFQRQSINQHSKVSISAKSKIKQQGSKESKPSKQSLVLNKSIIQRNYSQKGLGILRRAAPKQLKQAQAKKPENSKVKQSFIQKILHNKKSELSKIEKFPCAFCAMLITFQEISIHHNSCQMAFTCQKCNDIFPKIAQMDHEMVCQPKASKVKSEQSYLKYYPKQYDISRIPKHEQIDEDELYQLQFISQHPQIDPSILREHLRAEKENKYYNPKEYDVYNLEQQYGDDGSEQYLDEPDQSFQKSTIVKGLKDYQIQDLMTDFYHRGDNHDDDQCTICTKEKEQGQIIVRLPCFHVFHKECLVPWLQVKSICPTCKHNLK